MSIKNNFNPLGLLGDLDIFGGGIGGSLLTPEQNELLRDQSMKTTGTTALLSYFAQPKNKNAGSAVPYLAQAGLTGYGAGQNVYNRGISSFLRDKTLTAALGKQSNSPFAKVDATKIDYSQTTPEDIAKYQETQNPSFLKFKPDSGDGMPSYLGKIEFEELDKIRISKNIADQTSKYIDMFAQGQIPVGPIDKALTKIGGKFGVGEEDLVNLKDFERFKTNLRNESLRLNKGVQTEGDAQRALEEFDAANTVEDQIAAMAELRQINARGARHRAENLNLARESANQPYKDYGVDINYQPTQLPNDANAIKIIERLPYKVKMNADFPAIKLPSNDELADKIVDRLPIGAYYVGSDGRTYKKKGQ